MPVGNIEKGIRTVGAAIALSVGVLGCSGAHKTEATKPVNKCDTSVTLTDLRIIGAAKDGGFNAINSGECISAFSTTTMRNVGRLAHNEAFVIECFDGPKPASFHIETADGVVGDVKLSLSEIGELKGPGASEPYNTSPIDFEGISIPQCGTPEAPTSLAPASNSI